MWRRGTRVRTTPEEEIDRSKRATTLDEASETNAEALSRTTAAATQAAASFMVKQLTMRRGVWVKAQPGPVVPGLRNVRGVRVR